MPRQSAAGLYRENVVAGMGKAGAQLLGRRGGLHLLHDSAALIGQLDDKLCHALPGSPPARRRFSSYLMQGYQCQRTIDATSLPSVRLVSIESDGLEVGLETGVLIGGFRSDTLLFASHCISARTAGWVVAIEQTSPQRVGNWPQSGSSVRRAKVHLLISPQTGAPRRVLQWAVSDPQPTRDRPHRKPKVSAGEQGQWLIGCSPQGAIRSRIRRDSIRTGASLRRKFDFAAHSAAGCSGSHTTRSPVPPRKNPSGFSQKPGPQWGDPHRAWPT